MKTLVKIALALLFVANLAQADTAPAADVSADADAEENTVANTTAAQ